MKPGIIHTGADPDKEKTVQEKTVRRRPSRTVRAGGADLL